MKISENILYFVFGVVLMFFAAYIFQSQEGGQLFFRGILGFMGLYISLSSIVEMLIS